MEVKMKKKGSTIDFLLYSVIIFGVVIATIIVTFLWNTLQPSLPTDAQGFATNVYTSSSNIASNIKYVLLFVIIGVGLLSFILAVLLPSNPILQAIGILLLIISIVFGAIFSNIYDELAGLNNPIGNEIRTNYGPVNAVMFRYPLYYKLNDPFKAM